jgi:hypothetical protein
MALYNYDPMQSLASNLSLAGLTAPLDSPTGQGSLDPRFVSAIQTALARAGQQDYGGQTAFNLLSGADQNRAFSDPFGYANELLATSGVSGFGSAQEWQNANQNLAGHNESLSDISGFADIPGELLSEPGFRALLAAGGAGSMMGPAGTASGSAAAGGTAAGTSGNAAIMSMGTPISAAELTSLGFDPLIAQLGGASAAGGALGASTGAPGGTGLTTPAYGGGTLTEAGVAGGAGSGSLGTGLAAAGTGGTAAATGIGSLLSSPVALGMGAGALLGGLGGSQQAGTVTVEEGLPDWLKAYAKPALDKYSTDLQNYQIDPYGVMPSAMKEFQNTISGMYLDPSTNKYLEDYFKLGAERIKGSLSPSFGHMQAFGQHSGYNESLSRGLGDFATGLYGGNYAKERDRQTQLTAAAPAFIGQSSQAAFQPYSQYLQTIGSLGKKKDEPYFENTFGNILGGALAGGSLGRIWG